MSGGYPHLRLFVSQCYKSRTVNHDTISTHSILFHSQHLQLRKVYPISLSTKHSPCILKVLLSFVTSVRSLTFSPKHSPTQANDPSTISVRFGRSIHHTSKVRITGNRYCNHFGKTLHSQFDSLHSSQVYTITHSLITHSQSSVRDSQRNRQRTPSPCPPPASSTRYNLHVTTRKSTHLAQQTPRTEHNSGFQYTTHATPHSHAQ